MAIVNNATNAPVSGNAIIIGNSAGTQFTSIAAVATGSVLVSSGTGSAPAYSANPSVTSLTASTGNITATSGTVQGNILNTTGGQVNGVIGINGISGNSIQISTVPPGVVSLSTSYNAVVPLRFAGNAGVNYVSLQAPATIGTSFSMILPATVAASTNAPLVSSTAGVLSFGTSIGLGTASTTTGSIVIYNSTNSNTITIQSGATSTSGGVVWTLPVKDGNPGQALTTNGSGVLGWTTFLL